MADDPNIEGVLGETDENLRALGSRLPLKRSNLCEPGSGSCPGPAEIPDDLTVDNGGCGEGNGLDGWPFRPGEWRPAQKQPPPARTFGRENDLSALDF